MRDKILFLTDMWFFNFATAKFLQKKYDADFYTIIDVNPKARKFFEEQQIVKYKKIWFYLDCLKNLPKKPDIDYLREFEKRYNLNLWLIAFQEREFYQFNRYYKFSDDKILTILENECKFFEKILDEVKPDFISMYFSISHFQELLREMCKSKGIKILMLGPARIGGTMMISEKGLVMDNYPKQQYKNNTEKNNSENFKDYIDNFTAYQSINDYVRKNFENKIWERYKPILKFFFSKSSESIRIRYTYYGHTKFNVLKNKVRNFLTKKYRAYFIQKFFLHTFQTNIQFAYFPMHFEPERILLIDSPFHGNQIEIIKNVAKALPVDFLLYVKEHPVQKILGWREISFYKELLTIPNVRLIHPAMKPESLLKNCKLVITIAGTGGLEALFFNKPVITFTKGFYSSIPSVCLVEKIYELPDQIKKALTSQVNKNDLDDFMNKVKDNVFPFEYTNITSDFAYRFGFKGPIMDANIQSSKIQSFLDYYSKDFELLADEHLKKILQLKELK